MKMSRLFLPLVFAILTGPSAVVAADDWIPLFDGKTLHGWKASENPGSPRVADGAIVSEGKRAHLFYVGEDGRAEFENFELELEIKAEPGANSGVYFQTKWQDAGWPEAGFESQVNNRQPPFKEYDYRENKKTASLYGIRNLYKALVQDGEWFTVNIRVARPRVEIRLNGRLVTSYTEPANPVLPAPGPRLNLLGKGTFALQCHDEDSRAYYRNIRVRRLPPGEDAGVTKPVFSDQDLRRVSLGKDNFPIVNLRVRPDASLTPARLQELRTATGIFPGIVHSAFDFADDAAARRTIAALRDAPVFAGLQVWGDEPWDTIIGRVSRETWALFDYVVGGPNIVVNVRGREHEQAEMNDHVDRIVRIIASAPIDILANVMVLPEGFYGTADVLWTEERMQRVIAAAVKHGVAVEINHREPTPSLRFVQLAKAAGVKFTIGSDAATAVDYADWSYLFEVQEKAGLGWRDMWVPGHFPTRAQKALAKNPD